MLCSSSPESAHSSSFEVEAGDVILLGTDGLFDNMTDDQILTYIDKLQVNKWKDWKQGVQIIQETSLS